VCSSDLAFLEYAKDNIGFRKGLDELQDVKRIFAGNPEFCGFLKSPEFTHKEKCDFLEKIFCHPFSEETVFFLKQLLKKGHILELVHIAEYSRRKYEHGEEVEAVLQTTYTLDIAQLEAIKDELQKKFKKKLHFYSVLEPDLLGGIKVVIGNFIIDGSIKKRLDDLRRKLTVLKVDLV
jgi:F-type H+-transporting ATPase subunit delta